jgi:GTP-binding protein
MTEGNFVDYVKIYVSEREEKDLRICIEKNLLKKVGQMEEMVVWTCLSLVGNKGLGHYFTLNLRTSKGNGGDGSGDRSTGADGDDKFIEVPLGTVVKTKKPEKYYLKLPKMVKTNSISRWKRRFR